MEDNLKLVIKKYCIIFALFTILVLSIWGLSVLGFFLKEDSIKKSLEYVFLNSPLCTEYKDLSIQHTKINKQYNQFNGISLLVSNDKRVTDIFIFPIMGKYGIFQGVFVYKKDDTVEFCGLISVDFSKPPQFYGVNNMMIQNAKYKITQIKGSL